jgi:hypothetical protein
VKEVVKVILIQSPDTPKCIPESVKTTHWAGLKKLGFLQRCLDSSLQNRSIKRQINMSYFFFVI